MRRVLHSAQVGCKEAPDCGPRGSKEVEGVESHWKWDLEPTEERAKEKLAFRIKKFNIHPCSVNQQG